MLNKNFINYKYLSNIIYCCLIIVLFNEIICLSTFANAFPDLAHFFNRLKKVANIVLVCVYIFSCYRFNFDKKHFIIFILLMLFVAVSKKTWLIFDLLFVPLLLSKYISLNRLYKVFFYTILLSSVFIFVLAYFSVIPTVEFRRHADGIRYVWGFAHPNELGFVVMVLCFLFTLIKYKESFYYTILFLIFACVSVFYGPNSITSCFIIFLFVLCLLCAKIIKTDFSLNVKKIIFITSILGIMIFTFGLYYLSLSKSGIQLFSGDFFETFRSRLELANKAMSVYGFSFFGHNIKLLAYLGANHSYELPYIVIDSALFYLPIIVGVVPTVFLIYSYFYSLKKTIDGKKIILYSIHMLLFVYSLSECLQVTTCLCMFVFAYAFKADNEDV